MLTKRYRFLMLTISFIILIAIVWYAEPLRVIALISAGDLRYIALAMVVSTFSMSIRVLKWKVLLNNVGFREIFPVQMLGISISNFTPGKIGEPTKALLLKMRKGIGVSQSLPSIIWERIIDVIVLILLSFIAIQLISFESKFFLLGILSIGVFSLLIVFLLTVLYSSRIGMKVFSFIRRFPILNKIGKGFIDTFYKSKIKKRRVGLCFVLTTIPWLLEGVILYLAFMVLGIETTPLLLAGIVALSLLIGIASFLPGGLGSTEAGLVILLGLIHIESSVAIAGVLLYRFMTFWYGVSLGFVSFLYLSRKIDVKKAIK